MILPPGLRCLSVKQPFASGIMASRTATGAAAAAAMSYDCRAVAIKAATAALWRVPGRFRRDVRVSVFGKAAAITAVGLAFCTASHQFARTGVQGASSQNPRCN